MHTKIKGFPTYDIYADGTVINNVTNKVKVKRIVKNYYYVDLHSGNKRQNFRLGRLVARHFLPNPKNFPQVNHIDGNCLNDDVNNLEWITVSENQKHKNSLYKKKGIYKSPKGRMKFKRKKIDKVIELRKTGLLHKEIAKKLKMGVSTVTHILLGTRRKNQ